MLRIHTTNLNELGDGSTMDFETLQASGILLEANRQFFHPIGLALAIVVDKLGTPDEAAYLAVLDYSKDPEGMAFEKFTEDDAIKFEAFRQVSQARHAMRSLALGYVKQPFVRPSTEDKIKE